jgi:hypothetical protein
MVRPRAPLAYDRPMTDAGDLLAITCPRCGNSAEVRFYGPCPDCRTALRATLGREPSAVEAAEYEPKMNVTPNAVALKE